MGFLDNDSVNVDAILTKHGRKLLAEGQGLQIDAFSLADDGVHYELYNTADPSGSDSYARAIVGLPMQEAYTNASTVKYHLTTRPRTQKFQPFIKLIEDVDGNGLRLDHHGAPGITLTPYLENGSQNNFAFKFSDETDLVITGGKKLSLSGSTVKYPRINSYYVPEPAEYHGKSLNIQLGQSADKAWQFVVEIFERDSGAAPVTVVVNVDATELISPTDKITGTKGGM